jgi:hypothetical protein
MGSFISSHNMYLCTFFGKSCYYCKQKITVNNYVICVRCKIKLHDECETKCTADRSHCLCPNPACKKVGSLGSITLNNK